MSYTRPPEPPVDDALDSPEPSAAWHSPEPFCHAAPAGRLSAYATLIYLDPRTRRES
jgi:hypothetical protein